MQAAWCGLTGHWRVWRLAPYAGEWAVSGAFGVMAQWPGTRASAVPQMTDLLRLVAAGVPLFCQRRHLFRLGTLALADFIYIKSYLKHGELALFSYSLVLLS